MNILWDVDNYTDNFSFVHQYGKDVIELIDFQEKGLLIDLGCGNGALSKVLKDKGFDVIGIDSSKELLDIAQKRYPDISFIQADATNFSIDRQVDVVFSNAVFHWIDKEKQPLMLSHVYNTLKENGQFVFEFGGYKNNDLIHKTLEKVFSKYGYEYKFPFYFPTIGEYAALVEQAGFIVQYGVLFDRPTELKGENGLKDWINMFVKTPFSIIDDMNIRNNIIDETVEELRTSLYKNRKWYADYVRIRMKAVKKLLG